MKIGAHVSPKKPLDEAAARNADAVQVFLANPQSWKAPLPRDDAEELKAAGIEIYVHATCVRQDACSRVLERAGLEPDRKSVV